MGGELRVGDVPPLAAGFSPRPETGPGPGLLQPGQSLALTPRSAALRSPSAWPASAGLTQCAVSLAEGLWRGRQIDLLIWVPAVSRASVHAGLARGAAEAARVFTDAPRADWPPAGDAAAPSRHAEAAAERFAAWLAGASRPWLVVFDGIASEADVDGVWPEGAAGRVLATVRDSVAVPRSPRIRAFGIPPFSQHEALTYLMARLSADPDQRVGAVDLLAELGGEPVALAQAAATIGASSITCRDYRELLLQRREQTVSRLGAVPSVSAVTCRLALEQAERLAPGGLARRCLSLAALCAGQGIPAGVFASPAACRHIAGMRSDAADQVAEALTSLQRVGLLGIDPASTDRRVLLPLATRAAVLLALPLAARDEAAVAAADALAAAWPADDAAPWTADAFRSCAASLEEAGGEVLWGSERHAILFHAARSLDQAGLAGSAVGRWEALAAASEARLGVAHPDSQQALERLAQAWIGAGGAEQAVAVYQRIAALRSGASGPGHPSALAASADAGAALLAAGQVNDAISVLEQVLDSWLDSAQPGEVDVLAIQDRLAAAYRAAGRVRESISLGSRTLAQRERHYGADHPTTAATRARLASAYLAAGEPESAIAHGRQALADRERLLGRDHPDTLDSLIILASAYHSTGQLKEAIPLYERVLGEAERAWGADDRRTLSMRGNLASAYHSAGKITKALPLYERARAEYQRALGPHHPDTLTARANLAHAYCAVGRLAEAVTLLRSTLADCEQALAPADPLTEAVRESLRAVSAP